MREFHSLYELQLFWDCKKHAISFSLIVGYFKAFFISNFFQIQQRISFASISFCFHLAYLSKGNVNDPTCEWKRATMFTLNLKKARGVQVQYKINEFLCLSLLLLWHPKKGSKSDNRIGGIRNIIYDIVPLSSGALIKSQPMWLK